MSSTSATGLPVMTSGDAPNIPADVGINLAGALDTVTVPLFASTSARDAAYATMPFGLCFVGTSVDAGTLYRRRGGSWYEIKDIGSLIGTPVTSGLGTFSPGTSWSIGSYWFRKVAGRVEFVLPTTYTGSTVTADSTGNIADQTGICTLPAAWSPISSLPVAWPVQAFTTGANTWFGRLNTSGRLDLWGTQPGVALSSGTTLNWYGAFPVS